MTPVGRLLHRSNNWVQIRCKYGANPDPRCGLPMVRSHRAITQWMIMGTVDRP